MTIWIWRLRRRRAGLTGRWDGTFLFARRSRVLPAAFRCHLKAGRKMILGGYQAPRSGA